MQRAIIKEYDENEISFKDFGYACNTEATKNSYTISLNQFMDYAGYTSYDKLAKTPVTKIKSDFADYFRYLRDRFDRDEIKWNYFRPRINALELFLIINDVEINFKKFKKQIPGKQKVSGNKPYETDEIIDMLKEADVRGKSLVLFLCSTGIRGGAIWDYGNYLKFKHLQRFDDGCARVTIYPDTDSEHPAMLTPEAVEALDKYKRFRIANGEQIDGESPLFRNIFRKNLALRTIKPLSKSSIDAILRRLAENIGIRTRGTSPYERHEKRTEYGFRIRWNTIMKNHEPPLNNNKIERLFSHNNKNLPLDKHYNKPLDAVLHEEFDKAILALTIDPTKQQAKEIELQREKITELSTRDDRIKKLEKKVDGYEKVMAYIRQNRIDDAKKRKKSKESKRWLRPVGEPFSGR